MDVTRGRRNEPCEIVEPTVRVSLLARVAAILWSRRFDRMLAVGVIGVPGSPLAVHADHIVAVPHRRAIARTLCHAVRDSHDARPVVVSFRLPTHRSNVELATPTLELVTRRLHSPQPVSPRGMARLRLALCDGAGPFYEGGRGDLEGRLGAALAAL